MNFKKVYFLFLVLLLSVVSCDENGDEKNNKNCDNKCKSYEVCKEEKCVLKDKACRQSEDCGDDEVCNANQCVKKEAACGEVNCNEWEYCNKETNKCEIISGKCNDDTDCEEGFVCKSDNYCQKNGLIYTTIQNLQTDNGFLGNEVQTKGIVTAVALSQRRQPKGLYLQFGEVKHSGIYVYFTEAGETDIKVGDRIIVKGIVDRENQALRIRTGISDIEIIKSGEMPYKEKEVNYFNDLNDYESMLVEVMLTGNYNLRDILPQHWVFADRNDLSLKIFVKDTISYLNNLKLYVKLERLKGIFENFNGLGRILPRSEDDIWVYEPNCSQGCLEWEECLDNDYCVLGEGRCIEDNNCSDTAKCNLENHYCEEASYLNNGDVEEWENSKPKGYLIGEALNVEKENNKSYTGEFSAKIERVDSLKTDNASVEFLSPPVSVDFDKNYELSLFIIDNDYDVDAKIYYKAYDVYDNMIGSGIAGSNDFTINVDNWVNLTYSTNFVSEIWSGIPENLSYIRFGIRLYKGHCDIDDTCPENYESSGTGFIYLDTLSIDEVK